LREDLRGQGSDLDDEADVELGDARARADDRVALAGLDVDRLLEDLAFLELAAMLEPSGCMPATSWAARPWRMGWATAAAAGASGVAGLPAAAPVVPVVGVGVAAVPGVVGVVPGAPWYVPGCWYWFGL